MIDGLKAQTNVMLIISRSAARGSKVGGNFADEISIEIVTGPFEHGRDVTLPESR